MKRHPNECNVVGCYNAIHKVDYREGQPETWKICENHRYLFAWSSEQIKEKGIRFKDG